MGKRKQKANTIKNENIVKRLRLFLLAALTVITFYPPYLQGLFFEKNVLPAQMIVFSVFIVFLVYKWLKNDYAFLKTPIDYVALGFVVVYFISIFVAVHTRSAIIEWLKYCMYFAVFYMITDLADNLKTKLLFLWTIVISAVGVSVLGLDAAMGGNIVELLNRIYKALGAQSNLFFGLFVDNRIHSTLQYPNALASYLMAVFFISVGLFMVHNKWWQKIILGSCAFILFLTFMLTRSRGAQLLFPVAVIILLIAAPKGSRIKTVTHVLLLAIPAGVISLFVSQHLSADTLNTKALLLLLIGLLTTALISIVVKFIGNFLQKINWKVYVGIISVCIIASAIALNQVINSSVPAELSLLESEENKTVSISKDVALKPNKEYILRFEAEGKMIEEKPYAFFVRVFNKNLNNILFYGSEQLLRENFPATTGPEKFDILFTTKEDTKLINVNFAIYHSGTGVTINNTSIIDAETGKTVKNIILKNKYNLDSIISRFQNIWLQQSLVSRAIFYKDGFNIFKDRWFLGAGGGAWNYLYRQYQSYNYASSQAHNYPLQLGIETGILGIIILLGLVIVLIVAYYKYCKKINDSPSRIHAENSDRSIDLLNSTVITAIAALFIHSIIDFDFSESSMLLLFWSLIALFNRELIDNKIVEDIKLSYVSAKQINNEYNVNRKSISTISVGIVISVVALYFSTTFFTASSFAKQSFESLQSNDIETAVKNMEMAIKLDKYNEKYVLGYSPVPSRPDIKAGLTDILFMKNEILKKGQESGEDIPETDLILFQNQFSKAVSLIKGIEKKAKNNLHLTSDLASFCFKFGEVEKGIDYLNSAIGYYPFEPSLWHSKVDVYYQLMANSFNNEEYEKAEKYLSEGLKVIDEAREVNKKNMNPFVFKENTVELLQKMKYMKDNWNSEELHYINDVIHYSMFDLDVNMDDIPDQWRISNTELLNVYIHEEDLYIQATEWSYLHSHYPIKLNKGKTYKIEIITKEDVNYLEFIVIGITPKILPLTKGIDRYVGEFTVENEPSKNGNQFRIYINSDCVINSIHIKEMK